jgi:acetyl esterase/lipase
MTRDEFSYSPLKSQNLSNFPLASILTAEFDPLKDEGNQAIDDVAEMLKAALALER